MKILIYLALIIAFLMFYNSNPTISIIIVIIAAFTIFYIKFRKKGNSFPHGKSFSGKGPYYNNRAEEFIILIMLQQLLSTSEKFGNEHNKLKDRANNHDRDIKKMKREILELLEN